MTDKHERGGHTPEPWEAVHDTCAMCREEGHEEFNFSPGPETGHHGAIEGRANARRIVACVNALAGVPTETLEQEVPPDSPAGVARVAQDRADAAEALLVEALNSPITSGKALKTALLRERIRAFLEARKQ